MKHLLVCILVLLSPAVFSYEKIELELESGTTFSITQFSSQGKKLLLWLPSERGFTNQIIPSAMNLALSEVDVWAVHLHETYMVPTGRYSLRDVDISDLVALINTARESGFEQVNILSSGRGTELALSMAYQWQLKNQGHEFIRGLLFFSPHIYHGYTEIGDSAEFIKISALSNLPIYIFQEEFSTKYARIKEIVERLQMGGSAVFVELLKDIRGGFYMRPDEDLTTRDINMRKRLPGKISRAINLLSHSRAALLNRQASADIEEWQDSTVPYRLPQLHPYKGNRHPPQLKLPIKSGGVFDLHAIENEIILINFWATWCAPCVEEIPSLTRLKNKMKGLPFRIVAVNIGESEKVIAEFQQKIPFDFDVLLDADGKAVRDWKVYAYPSNFVIDQERAIRYAYRGALQWDAEPVVKTIKSLIQ